MAAQRWASSATSCTRSGTLGDPVDQPDAKLQRTAIEKVDQVEDGFNGTWYVFCQI